MITVVARWETTQMPPEVEWNIWRQLNAFKVDRFVFVPVLPEMAGYPVDQYDTMEEAIASTSDERVFLEPTGTKRMGDLPQGDLVLICGNTAEDNLQHANADEIYRINCDGTPDHSHLYGSTAAGIALAIRKGQ